MTQSIPTHEFALCSLPAIGEDCAPPFSAALYTSHKYGSLTTTETFDPACTASEVVAGLRTAI